MTTPKALRGGEFIIRDSVYTDVFIPEEFNEDQRMVKQMCQDFVAEIGDKAHELDAQVELMEKSGDLGLLGAHIPEMYGGNPLDTNANTLIADELGKAGGSFDTTFAAHIGIGMLPILYFGTDEQKKKYLPKLCSGEMKAAYCLTEPGSGSDALAAKTRADLSADGKQCGSPMQALLTCLRYLLKSVVSNSPASLSKPGHRALRLEQKKRNLESKVLPHGRCSSRMLPYQLKMFLVKSDMDTSSLSIR